MYKFISNTVFLYYLVDKEMVHFYLFKKYLGMVNNRPMLMNSCMNLHYMLETSNTLNTNNNKIFSYKVKDITMSNQQVAKNNILLNIIHI